MQLKKSLMARVAGGQCGGGLGQARKRWGWNTGTTQPQPALEASIKRSGVASFFFFFIFFNIYLF